MERLSDTAIEIINELHTERLDYSSEYIPLIDAANRLAAYEDSGLEPQDIISAVDMAKIACALHELNAYKDIGSIDHLRDLLHAEQDGRLVVLPSKTVWELTMDAGPDCDLKCPVDSYDEALGCDLCSKAKPFAYERPCTQERLKGLGKTVFLTREEAEAALQKGGPHETDPV